MEFWSSCLMKLTRPVANKIGFGSWHSLSSSVAVITMPVIESKRGLLLMVPWNVYDIIFIIITPEYVIKILHYLYSRKDYIRNAVENRSLAGK